MKPILKYSGGKSRELNNYIQHITSQKYEVYFEPFIGGGATYFYLEPKKAIINDVNSKLIDFYLDVKNNYLPLKKELKELECIYKENQIAYEELKKNNPDNKFFNLNEELYYKMRNLFNYPTDEFMKSTLYFFINKTAYSGIIRYNSKGEYNVPYGYYKNFNTDVITENHKILLQNTTILNTDYSNVFNLATPKDIMFLDPPYDCSFNDYGNLGTKDGFNEEEQRRLAEDFKNLNTRALMVIGKTKLTQELYGNNIIEEYSKNYSINIKNRFSSAATHIVVSNF